MEGDYSDGSSTSKTHEIFRKSVTERSVTISSATLDDEFYPLDENKSMGTCLIFNHKTFDCGPEDREGTDLDKNALERFFEKYGFEVKVHNDKKKEEIFQILENAAGNAELEKTCCFVCCVLTHGDTTKVLIDKDTFYSTEVLYAKDTFYPTKNLFSPFYDCPYLVNKPKMFFIQACRGRKDNKGDLVYFKHSAGSHLSEHENKGIESVLMCTLPKQADFLIAHSTIPGHLAWKNLKNGSWFIQELCKALNENAEILDLESILTIVRRKVALNYPHKPKEVKLDLTKPIETQLNQKKLKETQKEKESGKQIPSLYTTLIRKFRFPSIL